MGRDLKASLANYHPGPTDSIRLKGVSDYVWAIRQLGTYHGTVSISPLDGGHLRDVLNSRYGSGHLRSATAGYGVTISTHLRHISDTIYAFTHLYSRQGTHTFILACCNSTLIGTIPPSHNLQHGSGTQRE